MRASWAADFAALRARGRHKKGKDGWFYDRRKGLGKGKKGNDDWFEDRPKGFCKGKKGKDEWFEELWSKGKGKRSSQW